MECHGAHVTMLSRIRIFLSFPSRSVPFPCNSSLPAKQRSEATGFVHTPPARRRCGDVNENPQAAPVIREMLRRTDKRIGGPRDRRLVCASDAG